MGMNDKLFDKILGELGTIPYDIYVTMMKLGEPFLDPKICERLLMVDSLPNTRIEIHTNLNVLPPKVFQTLIKLEKLEYIWVSLNWMDSKTYKEQMGLSFEKTVANINKLLATPLADIVILGAVSIPKVSVYDWANWVIRKFPGTKCVKNLIKGPWCEHVETQPTLIKEPICPRLNEVSICCDGKVALCCMDGLCEYELGDVNNQGFLKIFNSDKAKLYRNTPRVAIMPCKVCNFE